MAFKRKEFHKEENCLNCGYPLVGKFCGHCGQKAFLHKDSFLHMAAHFAADYFHYDGKFWKTIKTLFTKPGLATVEYNEGKRAKYLNPIQLYIFVTTVYFLVAFSGSLDSSDKHTEAGSVKREEADSLLASSKSLNGINVASDKKMRVGIGEMTPNESTIEMYDSVQHSLPADQKDGFFLNHIRRKSYLHSNDIGEQLKHNFPKIFFLLLPLFAVFLALFFRKKKMYYVDHLIFSIHYHCVLFFVLIVSSLLVEIWPNDTFDIILTMVILIGLTIYLFLALKKVYPSPAWKIIIKQLLLLVVYSISFIFALLLLLMVIFLFF